VIRLRPNFCAKWVRHSWGKPARPPLAGYSKRQVCRLCGAVRPYEKEPKT
jgi:hypothetical protein